MDRATVIPPEDPFSNSYIEGYRFNIWILKGIQLSSQ